MSNRILVVDDEQIIRESTAFVLQNEGYDVTLAENGRIAYEKVLAEPFDLVITDLEMPEMKGTELLERVAHAAPQTLVMIITAYGSLETAITALRGGATDYILKPIEYDELLVKVRRLLDFKNLAVENQMLRRELAERIGFENIIGKSAAMGRVFDAIARVSGTDSTVLITGKSGTGKELVARAIHFRSNRANKPFITVNCGALTETLIESELFGHKKGAFTGAVSDKAGYFKTAEGGTLFLDEISEMPLHLQVRLLRAIEAKEVTPVGSSTPVPIDVRIIAATNRTLQDEVAKGRFREDLYYRLNVVEIHLPPLAERQEDIPLLVEYFIEKYRKEMAKNVRGVDDEVMRALIGHQWKGEIRELENIIERAVIFSGGEYVTMNDLPALFHGASAMPMPGDNRPLDEVMRQFEKQYITAALQKHNFDKESTAHTLKISLATLYRRIKDLGITGA